MFIFFYNFVKNSSEASGFPNDEFVKIYINGREVNAKKDEPLSVVLFSEKEKWIGTSIKYYRPRGIMSLDSFYRTTLVKVNGIPNVNPNTILCEEGLKVETLKRKRPFLLSISGSMLEAGFQHKTLIKKPFIWKIVENLIMRYENYPERPDVDSVKPAEIEEVEKIQADVVVVGGGLAGLSAAIETSKKGLKTVLIDDQPKLGGRSRFDNWQPDGLDKSLSEIVRDLEKEINSLGVEIYKNTVLIGFWEDAVTAYKLKEPVGGKLYLLDAKAYILATGSLELPCLYENNDLPGTITASAALRLVNEYNVQLGGNVAIIGFNDYSVRIAKQMADKGIKVTIITKEESLEIGEDLKAIVENAGIKVINGVKHLKAIGGKSVEKLTIKTKEGSRELKVDYVVFAELENSNIKLPGQAGIKIIYIDKLGFVPVHNINMETNKEDILVAGSVTGSKPEILRILEGKIAGLTVAAKLGKVDEDERDKVLEEYKSWLDKTGYLRWKEKLFKVYAGEEVNVEPLRDVPTIYSDKVDGKQFICFCEDITLKDLHKTVEKVGLKEMELIKRYTGISTGLCQGRLCLINASLYTSKILQVDPNRVGIITQRLPIIPVPMRVISEVKLE